MRRRAPDVLRLQVVSADVKRTSVWCDALEREVTSAVTLKARVVSVVRTAAGARPGNVITIEYTSLEPCTGWSGPRPIPILRKNDRVYAYLAKGENAFAPAARGASFSTRRD